MTVAPAILTICSWCERIIKPGPPSPVSHGVCLPCLARILEDAA